MTEVEKPFVQDRQYDEALRHLQAAKWPEAIEALEALSQRYPGHPELENLLEQSRFRAAVDQDWGQRIKARRLPFSLKRLLPRLALVLVFAGMAYAGIVTYRQWYLPNREQAAVQAQELELQRQGQDALARGDYEAARRAFSGLLDISPQDEVALAGLQEAGRQAQLAVDYEAALAAADAGDTVQAAARLRELQARAPGYRDVSRRLTELESAQGLDQLFAAAEEHYAAGRWTEAIAAYEALRRQSFTYKRATVEKHLFESYVAYGEALVHAPPPAGRETVVQAQEAFQRALSLRPREPRTSEEQQLAYVYLQGLQLLEAGEWAKAVVFLRSVYDRRADYLGGTLAQQLYRAYLSVGDAYLATGEQVQAFQQYEMAALLAVKDVGEALLRMSGLAPELTPTATATPTATPTPLDTPAPTPTPSPVPPAPPLWYHTGWIAFLSEREGKSGLYVMRSDGSQVRRLDCADVVVYEELHQAQQRSPDGKARVYAEASGANAPTNLYVFRDDLPADWIRRRVLVDHGKHVYDPVWSPDGTRVAFVSEKTNNDEIWVIHADGTDELQLTYNSWEWDKSPTWSPDGSKIAFWSNRITGHKQIWVMNADGSDQHNISNNEYDDWQPVWIRPDLIARVAEAITAAQARRAAAQATSVAGSVPPAQPTNTPTPTATPALPTPTPTAAARPPTATPGPTATPDPWQKGRIVFRSDRDGQPALYVMDPDGRHVQRVTDEVRYRELEAREAFSPDGRQQLVVLDNAGNPDIYAVTVDSTQAQRRLTSNSNPDYYPVWSPDGQLIAFVSERYSGGDIFLMEADGRHDQRLTDTDEAIDRHPSWSPDGSRIVFWSDSEGGRRQIWVVHADGSGRRNISNNTYNDWDPVWIK